MHLSSTYPLKRLGNKRETTLYIKGFMSADEKATDFEPWLDCHRALILTHDWGSQARGILWSSGSIYSVPFATTTAAAWCALRGFKVPSIPTLATTAVSEVALIATRLAYQYYQARVNAEKEAEQLSRIITHYKEKNEQIRIVAHSLGCYHLLHAIALLAPEWRPDEIHLCAPACFENEIVGVLAAGAAKEAVYIYHSENDTVLSTAFTFMDKLDRIGHDIFASIPDASLITNPAAGWKELASMSFETTQSMFPEWWVKDARKYTANMDVSATSNAADSSTSSHVVGVKGLSMEIEGVTSIDVSDHFSLLVHNNYKNRFHLFAISKAKFSA